MCFDRRAICPETFVYNFVTQATFWRLATLVELLRILRVWKASRLQSSHRFPKFQRFHAVVRAPSCPPRPPELDEARSSSFQRPIIRPCRSWLNCNQTNVTGKITSWTLRLNIKRYHRHALLINNHSRFHFENHAVVVNNDRLTRSRFLTRPIIECGHPAKRERQCLAVINGKLG